MVSVWKYDKIVKYLVTATCTEPLHIGNGENTDGQILVHPTDRMPFVQASSISGIFRSYYKMAYGEEEADWLFGSENLEENGIQHKSKLRVSDGSLCRDKLVIELRPRLKINPQTGVCGSSVVQGSGWESGHKFGMEYVGAGAQIKFSIYLYDMEARNKLESVFSAIQSQQIQFGGQKSSGCGFLRIDKLKYKVFHMTCKKDLELWMEEDRLDESLYDDVLKLPEASCAVYAYELTVIGKTDGELLVRSMMADGNGQKLNGQNIQNAGKDYMIPGSSLKGAIRSQMEKIACYLNKKDIIDDTFGIAAEKEKEGKSGNIRFFDTVIGDREKNDAHRISHRIHIDKFTGGVMHGSLFSERNAFGDITLRIKILDKNQPERTCGLLLLALRDLAVGMVSIGSGRNIGKGFLDVQKLEVKSKNGSHSEITFQQDAGAIQDEAGMISRCLNEVKGENKCAVM